MLHLSDLGVVFVAFEIFWKIEKIGRLSARTAYYRVLDHFVSPTKFTTSYLRNQAESYCRTWFVGKSSISPTNYVSTFKKCMTSKTDTKLELTITLVGGTSDLPKSGVRRRHVVRFKSAHQILKSAVEGGDFNKKYDFDIFLTFFDLLALQF